LPQRDGNAGLFANVRRSAPYKQRQAAVNQRPTNVCTSCSAMAVCLMPSRIFPRLLDDVVDDLAAFQNVLSPRRRKRCLSEKPTSTSIKRSVPVFRELSALSPDRTLSFCLLPKTISSIVDLLPLKESTGKKGPLLAIENVKEDENKMEISLNVSKYKPEELTVNLDGRTLTIEGKQEVNKDGEYSMRTFKRQLELPEDIAMDSIKSSLSEDGQLFIEAPKTRKRPREIPIKLDILKKRKLA
ncbi:Hsp20/alpha crystallin family protein, partial [Ancylostoma caninum]